MWLFWLNASIRLLYIMRKPLLITYEYPPQRGGVAAYLQGEAVAFDGEVRILLAQDYEMALWPAWLPLLWHVYRYFKPSRPSPPEGDGASPCDSLWVSHILPIGYIALVYKKLFKVPYRVYLHGLDLVRPSKSKWKSFWVARILNNADEIYCNSRATAQLLSRYNLNQSMAKPSSRLKIQYPRVKLPSLPAGVKEDWREYYKNAGEAIREQYNLKDNPILLTISRLVKRKGIDLVIEALPKIWKEVPNLSYVIVGDGEDKERLKKIAGKRASIIFTGSIEEEEKYAWLSACDCFILTPINDSNDFEGYGIVYKEAQMFGKPVIGSRVGGVPEAILGEGSEGEEREEKGRRGVLVEAGNIGEIGEAILKSVILNVAKRSEESRQ